MNWLQKQRDNLLVEIVSGLLVALIIFLVSYFPLSAWSASFSIALAVWAGCLYVYFRRKTVAHLARGKLGDCIVKAPYYGPPVRKAAFLGLLIVPVATATTATIYYYQVYRPIAEETTTTILVANFDGPEPTSYRVKDIVLNELNNAFANHPNVSIQSVDETVSTDAVATTLGIEKDASIVIWGWYGVTDRNVTLSVEFKILLDPTSPTELGARSLQASIDQKYNKLQIVAREDLEAYSLQTQLSRELAYFGLLTVALAEYVIGNCDYSIRAFSQAIDYGMTLSSELAEHERGTPYFYRANCYSEQKQHALALADYNTMLELDDASLIIHLNRGNVLSDMGHFSDAIADFTHVINNDSEDKAILGYINRALVFSDQGNFERAIADMDAAITLFQSLVYPIIESSIGEESQAKLEELAETFSKYTTLTFQNESGEANYVQVNMPAQANPSVLLRKFEAILYTNRGAFYEEQGDFDRAIADHDKAISINDQEAVFYYNRGVAYYGKAEFSQATEDFEYAVRLDKAFVGAYGYLASIAEKQNQVEEALRIYDRALTTNESADLYIDKGAFLQEQNRYDEAMDAYNRAIALDPLKAQAFRQRGTALSETCRRKEALADFSKAIDLAPNHVAAYVDRAIVYAALGDYAQAIHDYQKAIELNPNQWEVRSYLIAVLWNSGNHEQARQELRQLLEIAPTSDREKHAELLEAMENIDLKINIEFPGECDD